MSEDDVPRIEQVEALSRRLKIPKSEADCLLSNMEIDDE